MWQRDYPNCCVWIALPLRFTQWRGSFSSFGTLSVLDSLLVYGSLAAHDSLMFLVAIGDLGSLSSFDVIGLSGSLIDFGSLPWPGS